MKIRSFLFALLLPVLLLPHSLRAELSPRGETAIQYKTASPTAESFTFSIVADMRYYTGEGDYNTSQYFRGAVEKIASLGNSAFTISPGDIDPPKQVYWTITQTLGVDYRWYPVVGNHELPGGGEEESRGANLSWLNNFDYGAVNAGPSGCPNTTYSFDHESAHFVVLNEYCNTDGDYQTDGDISDHLYSWLAADLQNTDKTYTFVFGHEPAFPFPDAANGRIRHLGESLDQYPTHRDRFWRLLVEDGVIAYICGHTHSYSLARINKVWQMDVGHARGLGDTGTASTFIIIQVGAQQINYQTYRDNRHGGDYNLAYSGDLLTGSDIFLPTVVR